MKTVLITGGAGFIGSNFIRHMLKHHVNYRIINIDTLTYAGDLSNLCDVASEEMYFFEKVDIRDRQAVDQLFSKYAIDFVVNFAAETHVDRSIDEPDVFITTNIMGTQVLLDVAKNYWKVNKSDKYCKRFNEGVKFVQISTDEVYGALGEEGFFTESTPLMPNSPYSSSKASADLIVRAYHETYGLPINITRCSNNYGPSQYPEKLIPLIINKALEDKELPIYGDGQQVRDWLHVNDHCSAIDSVLHFGLAGQVYNVGGNNEKTNLELVRKILLKLDKSESLIKYVQDRPGHDRRYAIDNSKITSELGWQPSISFEDGLDETIEWYVSNKAWVKKVV